MKIGILSLNPGHNYGGILQSYALQTVLERMGHDVSVIAKDRYIKPNYPLLFIKCIRRAVYRFLLGQPVDVFYEKHQNENTRTYGKMLSFCSSKLHLKIIDSFDDIKENEFDAIVVGSDQVWRPIYIKLQYNSTIDNAYLKFAEEWNIKRIAYAPSFGVEAWEYSAEETKECGRLLKKFNAVSVREKSGIRLCNKYFNVKTDTVCDPTMLLNKEDYEQLVDDSIQKSSGDLFVYCLEESVELNSLVEKISKEHSMAPFTINVDNSSSGEKPSVETWLRSFMDAKFVITDSFHACVFSLIFRKPFVALGNRKRGMSRFESLLSLFNQEHRLLYTSSEYNDSVLSPSFDGVGDTFELMRNKSEDFLIQALQ